MKKLFLILLLSTVQNVQAEDCSLWLPKRNQFTGELIEGNEVLYRYCMDRNAFWEEHEESERFRRLEQMQREQARREEQAIQQLEELNKTLQGTR